MQCVTILGAATALAAGLATAADAGDRAQTVFQVTPYIWATGAGGDITPRAGAPTVSVSKSFSDLIRDLDAAFFISARARHGNLVFMGDLSTSRASRSGVVPGPGIPATAKLRQTSVTALAGYQVAASPDATVDLLAGMRYWRVRGEVDVPLLPAQATRGVSFTDPILAARANVQIAPDWSAQFYADIGGFGAGSRSTAQLLGTVTYQLRGDTLLSAGYRHLRVDYRDDGTRFDMRMGGPILGATFRF